MNFVNDALTVEDLERLASSAKRSGDAIHQHYDAELSRRRGRPPTGFDKKAYQREYMCKRREAIKTQSEKEKTNDRA